MGRDTNKEVKNNNEQNYVKQYERQAGIDFR